jgi:uncharacterized Zn finger protein
MDLRQNNSDRTLDQPTNLDEDPMAAIERWLSTREQRVRESEELRLRAERSVAKVRRSVDELKRSVGLE